MLHRCLISLIAFGTLLEIEILPDQSQSQSQYLWSLKLVSQCANNCLMYSWRTFHQHFWFQPKVIISANCGREPNRVVNYKPLLDRAIEMSDNKPQACLIYNRKHSDVSVQNTIQDNSREYDEDRLTWKRIFRIAASSCCCSSLFNHDVSQLKYSLISTSIDWLCHHKFFFPWWLVQPQLYIYSNF
jgi:hypothetical protein